MKSNATHPSVIEVVCKYMSLRNTENLIIWVQAKSVEQVKELLAPLADRIISLKALPFAASEVDRSDVDAVVGQDTDKLIDMVRVRTGLEPVQPVFMDHRVAGGSMQVYH